MTLTTTIPTSTAPRRVSAGWAAAALALAGVTAAAVAVTVSDDGSSTGPIATAPHAVVVRSADAAEHSALADAVVVHTTSADAAERATVAERDRQLAACRAGSADAAERCAQTG